METNFNFKSQICTDKVQSERLLALGLKKETADCHYPISMLDGQPCDCIKIGNPFEQKYHAFPAWSLHRLIEMIPKCVRAHSSGDDSPRLHPYVPKFDYQGVTIENIDEILADFYQHTDLFDNLIDCIEWLIKENYFNKEYLV